VTSFPLRDAADDDAPALAALFRRASLANPGDRAALLGHPHALAWTGPPPPPARCRVATDGAGGPPVGFATTTPAPGADGAVELVDLFVEPHRWRRGVARLLVADAVGAARDSGTSRVEVDANPHARDFYEAVGFVVVGETSTEFGPGLRMHLQV